MPTISKAMTPGMPKRRNTRGTNVMRAMKMMNRMRNAEEFIVVKEGVTQGAKAVLKFKITRQLVFCKAKTHFFFKKSSMRG